MRAWKLVCLCRGLTIIIETRVEPDLSHDLPLNSSHDGIHDNKLVAEQDGYHTCKQLDVSRCSHGSALLCKPRGPMCHYSLPRKYCVVQDKPRNSFHFWQNSTRGRGSGVRCACGRRLEHPEHQRAHCTRARDVGKSNSSILYARISPNSCLSAQVWPACGSRIGPMQTAKCGRRPDLGMTDWASKEAKPLGPLSAQKLVCNKTLGPVTFD